MDAEAPARPETQHSGLRTSRLGQTTGLVAVVLTGAIFGFFYAWVCSTMWGLDQADPRTAIAAMQAMNDSVQNAVFFPAFFLTPVALFIAGLVQARGDNRPASCWFIAAGVIYLLGGLVLTMTVNVPMNEDLAQVTVPASEVEAERIWGDYSGEWQLWNAVRTVASGAALALAAIGFQRTSGGARPSTER